MIGTSFAEQVHLFYIGRSVKVESRYKLGRYEIDIYCPEIKVGIEYDGIFFHSAKDKQQRDSYKNDYCLKHGIRLIRIKEADEDRVGNDIVFVKSNNYTNKRFSFSVNAVLKLLGSPAVDVDVKRDSVDILSQYAYLREVDSLSVNYPDLVKEWDFDKNGVLTPDMVSAHSHDVVWWKCEHGHSWLQQVGARTRKKATGCPYCSGRAVLSGENDLATKNPDVAAEWHPVLNGDLTPSTVAFKSRSKAWFLCSKCGHIWQAIIANRCAGRGCPICGIDKRGKQRTQGFIRHYGSCVSNPLLAKEWAYDLNGDINPQKIVRSSQMKVWWRCSVCGHVWQAKIVKRAMYGRGCPECGKLKVLKQKD